MNAGTLNIELLMNLARLNQGVGEAKAMLGNFARDVDRIVGDVKTALGSLGIGLGAGFFGALIKGSIDAMDHLNDLSKTTRIAAEDLAGLGFAAKQSGSDLDSIAAAVNKLAVNMGKGSEKFAALGVNARDPIEALKQLADATNAIEDPQQRAAVLAEALGKSWEKAAPLLAEGSAKIAEMVEKGKALSGITNENVRLADDLKDKWGELVGNGGALNATVGSMLPLLNKLADDLLKLKGDSGSGGFSGLAEILKVLVVLGGNVAFVLRGIGIEAGGLAAQLAALATGDFARFAEIGRQMKADAQANRAAFDAWEKSIIDVGTATKTTTAVIDAGDQVSRRAASDAAARARAFLETKKESKVVHEKHAAAVKIDNTELEEAVRIFERLIDIGAKRALQLQDSVDRMKLEIDMLGKSNVERAVAILGLEKEIALRGVIDDGQRATIAAKYEELKVLAQVKDAKEAELRLWTQVSDVAGSFFSDLVMHGKSAFDNLRKWVKQLLADMIALFAKRWVLQMAGVAGGATAGSDSLAGGLLNAGGNAAMSYAGEAIGLTGATGFVSNFAAGYSLAGTTGVAAAQGTAGFAAGEWMATLGATGWGLIIVAAVAVVAAIIGSRGGGPKVGGSYFSGGAVPGTDNGRFFTPDQGDAQVRDIVNTTLAGYAAFAGRLGGAAGAFNFGLGFDHDPNGSARSRVSSGLYGADGRLIYGARDVEMDDREVPAALQLEAKRAFVAMLQNTDLNDALDALFDGIDVSTATQEELDSVLAQALEMQNIIDALASWSIDGIDIGAIQRMSREGETLTQTFNSVIAAEQRYEQLFYTEAEQHSMSVDRMTRAFHAMGLELPTSRQGFRDLVESIDTTTEAGARLRRWLIEMAPAIADLYPLIDDTTTTVTEAADAWEAAGQVITNTMSGVRQWDDFFHNYYNGRGNRESVANYLNGLLIGPDSPLSTQERLRLAREQFDATLAAANAGDLAAGGRLQGSADAYIKLLQQFYASGGQSSAEFVRVFNALAGFAEVPDFNTRMLENGTKSLQYQATIADETRLMREAIELLVEQQDRGTDRVVDTVKSAALETARR